MSEFKEYLKEKEILSEALKPADKKVVHAFYEKKPLEGKLLNTDGKMLEKIGGMGDQVLYKWDGNSIKFVGVDDVKSTESVIKYVKKYFPAKLIKESVISEKEEGTYDEMASKIPDSIRKDFESIANVLFDGSIPSKKIRVWIHGKSVIFDILMDGLMFSKRALEPMIKSKHYNKLYTTHNGVTLYMG